MHIPNDNHALIETMLENRNAFLSFITRRLGPSSDAEDILQRFYLRAISHENQLKSQESTVAWLYRVLNSVLVDSIRSAIRDRKRNEILAAETLSAPHLDPDIHAEVCRCLHHLLQTIKPHQAELVRRIDLQGEARKDVARDLGLSDNTLGVRLHRARQALKDALLQSCSTCPKHGFDDCGCKHD
jgi:RNA polymerase sigma factor (sigma-70 family)